MSEESRILDGPLILDALGMVSITSRGMGTYILANGKDAALNLLSEGTASMVAGSAALILVNEGEGQGLCRLIGGALGSVGLAVGVPEVGPRIELTPDSIKLMVGPPDAGTSIVLTAASISLNVASVSLDLTPTGIAESVGEVSRQANPIGHVLSAAETEVSVGVTGISTSSPTRQETIDGGDVVGQTLASLSTDAVKDEQAGIKTTN